MPAVSLTLASVKSVKYSSNVLSAIAGWSEWNVPFAFKLFNKVSCSTQVTVHQITNTQSSEIPTVVNSLQKNIWFSFWREDIVCYATVRISVTCYRLVEKLYRKRWLCYYILHCFQRKLNHLYALRNYCWITTESNIYIFIHHKQWQNNFAFSLNSIIQFHGKRQKWRSYYTLVFLQPKIFSFKRGISLTEHSKLFYHCDSAVIQW